QTVESRKDFVVGTAGGKPLHVKLVEPVGRQTSRDTRVVQAVRCLKEQEAARFEDAGNFTVAGEGIREVLSHEVVKDKIECPIRKWQCMGRSLKTLIQKRISEDSRIGIYTDITSNHTAQIEMVLVICAGARPDFQNVAGRTDAADHELAKVVRRVI